MKNMRVLGYSRYCIDNTGRVWSLFSDRYLKPYMCKDGYYRIRLRQDSGEVGTLTLHRAVAKLFVDNEHQESKVFVNHIDGDKVNNFYKNLEWVTPRENNIHAFREGLAVGGYRNEHTPSLDDRDKQHDPTLNTGYSSFTDDDVHKICQYLQDGYRPVDISSMFGYDRRAIQSVKDLREPFKSIAVHYDFSKLPRKSKHSPEVITKICEMLQDTEDSCASIAKVVGVDRKVVENIKNRKTHVKISFSFEWD